MFGWGRRSAVGRGSVFRCGYCRGRVRVNAARLVQVRGQAMYVHGWHPERWGEKRLNR
jgi:hypothetical protein